MTKYSTELKIKIVSEFLNNQNSIMKKAYNALKEAREWLPFIE